MITVEDFLKLCSDSKQVVSLNAKSDGMSPNYLGDLLNSLWFRDYWANRIVSDYYFYKKELVIFAE